MHFYIAPDGLSLVIRLLLDPVSIIPGEPRLPPALPSLSEQTEQDGAHLAPPARAPGDELLTLVQAQLLRQLQGKLVLPHHKNKLLKSVQR